MAGVTLPIGSKVVIDPASEYFAGETVYVIDIMEGDEYTYFVSRSRQAIATAVCEWFKCDHVRSIHAA
jgi:hypothetical protein